MNGTTVPPILGPSLAFADPAKLVSIIAWLVFAVWVIYTVIAAYHWFRYGHQSMIAIPALAAHVLVSIALALFAVSGFK
ncbi:MAG TPA: hypothetical protein VFY28_01515 [Candidatus Paceibacterota bacterium]|nr:hypothetical protein [Candidatus Paceibacterota bacterium]